MSINGAKVQIAPRDWVIHFASLIAAVVVATGGATWMFGDLRGEVKVNATNINTLLKLHAAVVDLQATVIEQRATTSSLNRTVEELRVEQRGIKQEITRIRELIADVRNRIEPGNL